jgi:hypothetical protein
MRRQKRKVRQVLPKINKSDSFYNPDYIEEKETKKKTKKIKFENEEDYKREELVSRLNEAVLRWKEEKEIPKEEKKSAFSKIFEKFRKKGNNEKSYEEAIEFLNKIKNFNPEETEKINLNDTKDQKIKDISFSRHKNTDGTKLEIEIKENSKEEIFQEEELDLTKEKKRLKKEIHRKEIEDSIKKYQQNETKKELSGSLKIIEESRDFSENETKNFEHPIKTEEKKTEINMEMNKSFSSKPEKTTQIKKKTENIKKIKEKMGVAGQKLKKLNEKNKENVKKIKEKIGVAGQKLKKLNEKNKENVKKIKEKIGVAGQKLKTKINTTFSKLKKNFSSKKERNLEYPEKTIKEKDDFSERKFFLEKHEGNKINKEEKLIEKIQEKNISKKTKLLSKTESLNKEIEKIYKDIEKRV